MKPVFPVSLSLLVSIGILMLAATGCSGRQDTAVKALPGPTLESVNGEPVAKSLLEALARGRNLDLSDPGQYTTAMKELTEYVLLAQEAHREHFSDDSAFAAGVELNRLRGVANATLVRFQSDARIDDKALKAAYDQQIAAAGKVDYDFDQLIFASEHEALNAEAEVLAGKPFSTLLDEDRKDARSARSFKKVRANQLPDALAKSLQSLQPGETTKVPVETRFGWHVMHLVATHAFTPPTFESLKSSIRRSELEKIVEQRLATLRAQAKITLTAPPPAAASPAPGAAAAKAPAAAGAAPTTKRPGNDDAGKHN